ncbi:MAG TPA: hypothetical protein VG943_15305 [Caulobacterales bacterium]|nr:hypothetical protein [Caulobacterales bacterium]
MTERVVIDEFGLDEIVLDNVDVHIERMDKGVVWIGIYRRDKGERRRVSVFYSVDGDILRGALAENELEITPYSKD